jgi:leucyl-tRNA synthetase
MLSVYAPHLGCELYEMMTGKDDLAYRPWPEYDPGKLVVAEKEIAVQVNGKVRAKFTVEADADDEKIYQKALEQENVQKYIEGNQIKKHFVIRGRVVNIVV